MSDKKKARVEIIGDFDALTLTPFIGCKGVITKGTVETGALVMLDMNDEKTRRKIPLETRTFNTAKPIAFTSKELKGI